MGDNRILVVGVWLVLLDAALLLVIMLALP